MTDVEFPVDSFRAAAPHLRRPFTPKALRFKVQAQWPKNDPTGGLVVAYIDARLVIDRLNLILAERWHAKYEPLGSGAMWCHLTVDGVTRSDVGQGNGKGLVSDSLKRAAVHFGIGVSLYAIPKMFVDLDTGFVKQRNTASGVALEITPKGDLQLRDTYEHWLTASGIEAYGEPLDHGDTELSQGDPHEPEEVDAEPADLTPEPPPVGDPPPRRHIPAAPRAAKGKVDLIAVRARQAGLGDDELAELLTRSYDVGRADELTERDADHLLDHLTQVAA